MFHERVAMHRLQPQRLQNHDFESAGEKVAMFGILCHAQ
jgi:hypothetical protein